MEIHVFDFDGTLFLTPTDSVGKEIWKEKTGNEWPYVGWWSKAETLNDKIFDIPLNEKVHNIWKSVSNNHMTFLVTGRLKAATGMLDSVKHLLNRESIEMSGIYLSTGETYSFKKTLFEKMLDFYKPDKLFLYDDRVEHIEKFKIWASEREEEISVIDVNLLD